jgi:hypothetical protein
MSISTQCVQMSLVPKLVLQILHIHMVISVYFSIVCPMFLPPMTHLFGMAHTVDDQLFFFNAAHFNIRILKVY